MTLGRALVNLGDTEIARGLTYVALSRVTRVEDLLIDIQ